MEKRFCTVSRLGRVVWSGWLTLDEALIWDDGQGSFHMIVGLEA